MRCTLGSGKMAWMAWVLRADTRSSKGRSRTDGGVGCDPPQIKGKCLACLLSEAMDGLFQELQGLCTVGRGVDQTGSEGSGGKQTLFPF